MSFENRVASISLLITLALPLVSCFSPGKDVFSSPSFMQTDHACEKALEEIKVLGIHSVREEDVKNKNSQDVWVYLAERYNKLAPITTRGCLTVDILKSFNPLAKYGWDEYKVMPNFTPINIPGFLPNKNEKEWQTIKYTTRANDDVFSIVDRSLMETGVKADLLAFEFFNPQIKDSGWVFYDPTEVLLPIHESQMTKVAK
jgi:hypothetical protein